MDAVAGRGFDGAGGGLDVLAFTAGERGDAGAFYFAGDGADGVEVALGRDGETGFEHVDAEVRKLVSHAELFVVVHGATGRLLAVAEGRVKEDDLIRRGHRAWLFRSGLYHNACL